MEKEMRSTLLGAMRLSFRRYKDLVLSKLPSRMLKLRCLACREGVEMYFGLD